MLSPFRGFMDVQGEFDRLFDEMMRNVPWRGSGQRSAKPATWAPAIDVLTKDGDLLIRAELPGVKQEDVDITLSQGLLTISGKSGAEREEQHGGYYVRERRQGSFRRSIALPEGTDESKIQARFEDGVLEVTVTGAAAIEEPKRIQIEGPGE
ncbi:MAG TPA: Hsp20/alpha crystallin family protein [Rubrobacteraceae bacterium]|nr:Hsp20/alpha crystallin family protein [Rubrobacteraceae bacterium]